MSKKITPSNYSYGDDFVSAFFGLLLFIASLVALCYVCNSFSEGSSTKVGSDFSSSVQNTSSFVVSHQQRTNSERSVNTTTRALSVKGVQEVGEQVVFTIEHFSPEAQYRISFGDGTAQVITQQNVVHTYDRAAQYPVAVEMEYEGVTKTISTKSIDIFPAIEMKASIAEIEF